MDDLITIFATTNNVPATGLSPTIRIWEVAAGSHSLVVADDNMTEIDDGFYKYEFTTMDPLKHYDYRADTGSSQPAGERFHAGASHLSPDEISDVTWDEDLTTHNVVNSGAELLKLLIKFETNRTRIDPTAKTLTIFDDDETTPIHVFNLKDAAGSPSIIEVCERDPV